MLNLKPGSEFCALGARGIVKDPVACELPADMFAEVPGDCCAMPA